MSSSSDIASKWQALKKDGLDLGAKEGAEEDAGYGGRLQRYANGNIYWHRDIGTFEVHGGILKRYLAGGGPGVDATARRRVLGFPRTDEGRTPDGLHPVSHFEWGTIFWAFGGNRLSGTLDEHWRSEAEAQRDPARAVGYPIQNQVGFAQGAVVYFPRGAWFSGGAAGTSIITLTLSLPKPGRPAIAGPETGTTSPLPIVASCQATGPIPSALSRDRGASLLTALWQNRLFLKRVAAPGAIAETIPIECRVGAVAGEESFDLLGPMHFFLPAGRVLADRALYDVVFQRSDGRGEVRLAPHAIYSKSEWNDFGFIHATDLHASRRLDGIRARLRELKRSNAAREFVNYNDGFRDMVRYANHLHSLGVLDLIIATGDLVDYEFEDGDNKNGGGNFRFFNRILLGEVPYPDAETSGGGAAEELRVPIFTVPGNHDYRRVPYPFILDVSIPIVSDPELDNASSHNLTKDDAISLSPGGQKPTLSRERAHEMVEPDEAIEAYKRELNDDGSYIVPLGPHRLVMLNSRWDAGVLGSSLWDLAAYKVNGSESERKFEAGHPDQKGFSTDDLELVRRGLREAGASGLVVVGVHAPPLNPSGNERPFYFRETLHQASDREQVLGFLLRRDPYNAAYLELIGAVVQYHVSKLSKYYEGWTQGELGVSRFFRYGGTDALLDYGTSQENNDELLRICAGVGQARPVDLVLCGHGHNNVEFRLKPHAGNKLEYYTDFYTENPKVYYPTLMVDDAEDVTHGDIIFRQQLQNAQVRVDVTIEAGAPARPASVIVREPGYADSRRITCPPYPDPLSQTRHHAAWWRKHLPLVIQSPAVGPVENLQQEVADEHGDRKRASVIFTGFRVGIVRDGVIQKLHTVRLAELRERRFRLAWEPIVKLDVAPHLAGQLSGINK